MADYKRNRHACYNLKYHLVVVSKYRHPVFENEELKKELNDIVKFLFEEKWNCHLIEVNMDTDHIHILFEAAPQVCLANLINNFKTVSSRRLRKEFSEFLSQYYWKPYFWNQSYYIGSVSDTTTEIVRNYIQNQGQH